MSTPTRYQRWRIPILNEGAVGYAEPVEPDPDPEDPTDYAFIEQGGAVQVAIDVGTPALVQDASGTAGTVASTVSATFGATPQIGHTLIAIVSNRGTGGSPITPSGWTRHGAEVLGPSFDGGRLTFFYKTAGSSEATTVTVGCTDDKALYIAEWSGLGAADSTFFEVNNVAASTSLSAGPVTPTSGSGVLFAGFNQSARDDPTLTFGGSFVEDWAVDTATTGPTALFGHLIVDPFSGAYTATATSSDNEGYGSFLVPFAEAVDEAVWYPAPAANDGDSGTSAFSNDASGPCVRVILATERQIYRIELDIGQETAGATVYELYGSDDPTFTTTTLLATLSFTATGSFTLDAVTAQWVPTAAYPYYQLEHVSGGGNEREVYEIRLYSAVGVTSIPVPSGTDPGDLLVWDGDSWEVLPIGTDAYVLKADSGETLGVEWAAGGGGSGQGLTDFAFHKRTAGDYTVNSTTFTNLDTGTDLVLTAATGDVIEVGCMLVWGSEATTACLDVASIVSGSPVNYWGTAGGSSDFGITSWIGTTGQTESAGASMMRTLVSGDISSGTVTLRLRYRTTSATNKTLRASSTLPFEWWAKNLGPAM